MSTRDNSGSRGIPAQGNESITGLVVRTVAARSNSTTSELPPLFDSVDPDALDALFVPEHGDGPPSMVTVEFDYAGYDVTVYPDHTVHVEESGDPAG